MMDLGTSNEKPTVLLLGVFHMHNPGLDAIKTEFDDVLAPKRQQEIRECVEMLKRFKPTKIAVEQVPSKSDELNQEYKQYQQGTLQLSRNEVHQLGFRIAAELHHDEIYPVDWMNIDGVKYSPEYATEWAKENQPDLYKEIVEVWEELQPSPLPDDKPKRIAQMLGCDLAYNKRVHQLYMHLTRIGQDDEYLGMDWVMWWYRRNMTIYSNVTRLVASPDERILLMFGNGHIYLLKQFLEESGLFNVEMPDEYLA